MPTPARVEGLDTPPITLPAGAGRAESRLRRLKVAGRDFYILSQRGRFQDMAYDHGRLLAHAIEGGVFPEILASIGRGTDLGGLQGAAVRTLFRAISNRVLDNVSQEFRAAVEALADGYRDGLPSPRFSRQQVIDAVLAIEIEDLADGLSRRLAIPGEKAQAAAEATELCLSEALDGPLLALLSGVSAATDALPVFGQALASLAHPHNRSAFACTGFSVPASATRDGRHLHARNLDADLYSWNNAPTVFLADERPGGARHRYVAFGTAGLIYPGGISGINDAGIGVSLHQLSTTQYRLKFDRGRAEIAPFLEQKVLRDAGTLEEAVAIVRGSENFSAWIIFCSDARTGHSVRIEFNGRDTRLGPVAAAPLSQTNHFLHPDLIERLFDADDAHYTPTLGKWLETRTRMGMVDEALAAGVTARSVDLDWAIDLLSSGRDPRLVALARDLHLDPARAAVQRSFGRVPRKAYGQLMTIVRGDAARRAGADEAWMTVGDRLPGCQGTLIGWRIDWEGFAVEPVADEPLRRTRQYEKSGHANWEVSFERYLAARVAVVRLRDASDAVLERAPTEAETLAGYRRAEALLTEAIALAAKDQMVEVPYHYMRARVRHALGDYARAAADWDLLRSIWAAQSGLPPVTAAWPVSQPPLRPLLLDYEGALILALAAVTEDKRRGNTAWPGRAEQLAASAGLLADVQRVLFADRPAHFDLLAWIDRIDKLRGNDPDEVELPEPNFVTME